ncbi:TPA: hypothetical protein ACVNMC_003624 [Klebsiella pneumoniae]|nr:MULTISPECIES: hypothetical protein [Klebsiella]APC11464.1 hypothetical protein RB151_017840 [Providencia rettgeri]MEC5337122.1 hypothetical protein [Klebsiella oxytoca]NQE43846.1 hypothetical protein [Klebsiella pneumoniae subsp. pneumoniae]
MTTLASFANPISVIQRSPTSGVFGTNQFVGDKEGFVQKVLGKWYCNPGNTIPVESMSHLEQAEKLYDFYVKGRGAPPNYLECIMEKHNLKSGFSIYFADVHFEKQVYAFGSGLGFTSVIYAYSLGRDPEEAEKLALEKYDSDETKVKKVHVNLARSQDINRYTFPEQMAGFANAIQSHGIAVN